VTKRKGQEPKKRADDPHPLFSKIIAIGTKRHQQQAKVLTLDNLSDERELLEKFWEEIRQDRPRLFITYNGYDFDVPFLLVRSMVNGVKPEWINQNKWKMYGSNHFDCLVALGGHRREWRVKLRDACESLGIQIPNEYGELTGGEVQSAYERKEWEKIARHCDFDVQLTESLYEKISGYVPGERLQASYNQIAYLRNLAREKGLTTNRLKELLAEREQADRAETEQRDPELEEFLKGLDPHQASYLIDRLKLSQ